MIRRLRVSGMRFWNPAGKLEIPKFEIATVSLMKAGKLSRRVPFLNTLCPAAVTSLVCRPRPASAPACNARGTNIFGMPARTAKAQSAAERRQGHIPHTERRQGHIPHTFLQRDTLFRVFSFGESG